MNAKRVRCALLVLLLCSGVLFAAGALRTEGDAFFEKDVFEKAGSLRILRLGRLVGDGRGLDAPGGSLLAVHPEGGLWLARRRSLTRVSFAGMTTGQYWLPAGYGSVEIASLYVSRNAAWVGLSDGRIARRMHASGNWQVYTSGRSSPQRLIVAGGSLLAFSQEPGGSVVFFDEAKGRFLPYFSLPERLALVPRTVRYFGTGWYLGTDLGLFRVERPGTDNMKWAMQGSRHGLSLMTVHDCLPAGNRLLVASSVSPYPRLARHIRLTSYGDFVFQYFQGRWERYDERTAPDLLHFLQVNASNTSVSPNGLWVYEEGQDRAWTVRGAEDEFYRLIQVDDTGWLAAGAGGLYRFGRVGQEYRALRIVALPRLWIDDLQRDSEHAYVLSSRSLYAIPLKEFARGDTLQAVREGTNSAEVKTAGTNRRSAGQPQSEDEAFVRQIKRYLAGLRRTGTDRTK